MIGPVEFGGVRFWAVARYGSQLELGSEPLLELVGCLVCGTAGPELQQAASLLAAYTPRAIVVEGGQDLTHLMVDAALLDQGLVEVNANAPGACPPLARERLPVRRVHGSVDCWTRSLLSGVRAAFRSAEDCLAAD